MICTDCARAADQRAGRDQHCTDAGCTCGHRAARYQRVTGYDVIAAHYAGLAAIADQTAEVHPRTAVRPIGEPFRFPPMVSTLRDDEDPEEPFAIPSHVLGIYQAQADDAQAHAAAVEAARADRACTATLHRIVGAISPRRCTEQIHPGDYHHDGAWSWHDTDTGATPHADATPEQP